MDTLRKYFFSYANADSHESRNPLIVADAKVGHEIRRSGLGWIPAFAGMTVWAVGLWLLLCLSAPAQAECRMDVFTVTMATALSSRISHVGDSVEAILPQPLTLGNLGAPGSLPEILPAGAVLLGKVTSIERGSRKTPGRLRVVFNRTKDERLPFDAVFNTLLGWMSSANENTPVWQPGANRSTRLLTDKLMRRLGTDRAVWAQVLGINSNVIPDPTTDDFMRQYNRRDVLIGSGDRIQLRTGCR